MPSGFIQLLAKGNESEFLNDNPHISFFKCYYRRHTPFFINNQEIYSNFETKNKSLLTFLIPKSGDMLSKSYLKIKFSNYSEEVLNYYQNMATTLSITISTFVINNYYDAYYIPLNTYTKNDIKLLKAATFFCFDPNTFNNYLFILTTYIKESEKVLSNIKSDENIYITTNQYSYSPFYNINLNYDYVGFGWTTAYPNLLKDPTFSLLINSINYKTLRYLRIDFYNVAFKFTCEDYTTYQYLFNIILQNLDINAINNVKL